MNKLEQLKLYAYRSLAFLKQFLDYQNLQWNLLLVTEPQAVADSLYCLSLLLDVGSGLDSKLLIAEQAP